MQRQLDRLDARIAELESAPTREARWEFRSTGRTYQEAWDSSDAEGRRRVLRKSGITFAMVIRGVVGKRSPGNLGAPYFHIRVPAELRANLGLAPQPTTNPERRVHPRKGIGEPLSATLSHVPGVRG